MAKGKYMSQNEADARKAELKSMHEGYVARELRRLGGRRAVAGELKPGDRFVVPMRAEHEPETVEKVAIGQPNHRGSRVVTYKTTARSKSQWMEDGQSVVIL